MDIVDAKKAVQIAKSRAMDVLAEQPLSLEEIEREQYQGRDAWSITLGFRRNLEHVSPLKQLGMEPLQFRRFIVDVESGELLAMKLREVTLP